MRSKTLFQATRLVFLFETVLPRMAWLVIDYVSTYIVNLPVIRSTERIPA